MLAHAEEGAEKRTFMEEAPKAWEEYSERARRLQGNYTLVNRSLPENKVVLQSRVEFKQAEGCCLILDQATLEPNLEGELGAENPYYDFKLKRKGAEDPWVVERIGPKLWKYTQLLSPAQQVETILRTPYTLVRISESMRESLVEKVFSIGKVAQVEHEGETLYKVEFRYTPAKKAATRALCTGWVLVDPKAHWVIRVLDSEAKFGTLVMHYQVRYEYITARGAFPILKQTVGVRKALNKGRSVEETCVYELEERVVPEREFRLTWYGFPDPPGVPSARGSLWYLWFIAAAVVSLGIGWYLFRRLRKRTASPATKPAT